jgi:hypothetical protein
VCDTSVTFGGLSGALEWIPDQNRLLRNIKAQWDLFSIPTQFINKNAFEWIPL